MELLRLSRSRFHGFHALYSRWWAGALSWPFWTRSGEASPSAERVLLCRVHYCLCRSPRCPHQEPSGALMFCFSIAGTYKHYSFPMNLLSRWPRANGLLVSAFDIGVVPGWRVRVVAGMCRTARRSQFENALDSLGVRGAAERSWQRWYPDFSPGGERPSPACC